LLLLLMWHAQASCASWTRTLSARLPRRMEMLQPPVVLVLVLLVLLVVWCWW
jgi:hypothetical protein